MKRLISASLERGLCVTLFSILIFVLFVPTQAATLPSGFTETRIATGLSGLTGIAVAPDGRIFVCEDVGRVRVIKRVSGAWTLLSTPFVTVNTSTDGERGLLGIAFDPDFATNHFVYVYYTATSPSIHNRVSRFTASTTNPDVAVGGSEFVIIDLPTLGGVNHNGGDVHFGSDGKLYITTGDNQNSGNSQSLNTTLGKILRINKDRTIPSDNPFFNQTTGNNRAIWVRGLRNPYRIDVQPGTGRLFINEVGDASVEEINDGIAGSNYGWPTCEGSCSNPGFRNPIFQYNVSRPTVCAITGGAFYNPTNPTFGSSFVGKYFFSDFCAGWIRQFNPATGTASNFATGVSQPVDLAVDNEGALYYLARGNGSVFRITKTTSCSGPPTISTHPSNQTVGEGQSVTFTVQASSPSGCIQTFQWQRREAGTTTWTNISGATSQDLTFTATAADNGDSFRAVVSNNMPGSVNSNPATLTVIVCQPSTATITGPSQFSGGETLTYVGDATDPQDGALPASAFTWEVVLHHAGHTHPFIDPTTGSKTLTFTVPTLMETDDDIFLRVHLRVRNSCGRTTEFTKDVQPRKVTVTLATDPSGLQITLDGQPKAAPHTFTGVVGITRTIGTSSPQSVNGQRCTFRSWSDGGAINHSISTPTANTTFTASFDCVPEPCVTAAAGEGFKNNSFANQTGTFTAEFDATPSAAPINSVIALSNGPQTAHTGYAVLVRFNPSGNIDARNGGAYAAASTIPYTAGVAYRFRVVVNIAAKTYSVFVTPAGGSEITVGTNFAFRTEQNTVTSLNNWAAWVNATPTGSVTVCNFTASAGCTFSISPASQSFTSAGGTGSVSVAASAANCAWTATSNASFITVTSGSGGTGNGTVNYSVAPNTGPARSGTITIAGKTFTVNQAAGTPVCTTVNAGAGFQNSSFANQTGTFTAEFDATPSAAPINSTMGLSNGAQTAHTGFAVIARFNPTGQIDARNGGAYAAASTIPYTAGVKYHFRLVVNISAKTYSIFVTPAGGSEITVGTNFAFRTEQASVTSLNNFGVWVSATPAGSNTVCDFTTSSGLSSGFVGVRSSGYSIFTDDGEVNDIYANFMAEMKSFAGFFYPNRVALQTGDKPWRNTFVSPIPKTIGERLASQNR